MQHLGPAAAANHTGTCLPPAEVLMSSPQGGYKCKPHFQRVFLSPNSQNIPFAAAFCAVTWSKVTASREMLLRAQMVLLAVTMQFVYDWL